MSILSVYRLNCHYKSYDGGNFGGSSAGGQTRSLEVDGKSVKQMVTLNGLVDPDRGKPGSTKESLNAFLERSNGPLAGAIIGEPGDRNPLVELGRDGLFDVKKENVRIQAKQFVSESMDIEYGRDYIVKAAKEKAADNWIDLTYEETEDLINAEYKTRATAILTAAKIGDVKLTEAQQRRLEDAQRGKWLDMVYARPGSERGSLENAIRRNRKPGSYARTPEAAARQRQQRENFMEWVNGIDF